MERHRTVQPQGFSVTSRCFSRLIIALVSSQNTSLRSCRARKCEVKVRKSASSYEDGALICHEKILCQVFVFGKIVLTALVVIIFTLLAPGPAEEFYT
jgi:hypothetical protein